MRRTQGFVLPLTLIVCVIILTIATGISVILAKELYFSKLSRLSQVAYYAADNGLMCATAIDDKYIDPNTGIGIFSYSSNPLYAPSQVLQNYNTQYGKNIGLNDIECATSEIFDSTVSGYLVSDFARTNPVETGKSTTFSMRMDLGDGTYRCASITVNKTVNYRQIISRGFASCGTTSSYPIERAVVSTSEIVETESDTTPDPTAFIFTTSQSWTVPQGVSSIKVWAIGGGGGGAGVGSSQSRAGGAGGAGGLAYRSISVTPGQSISITIGSGGSGGSGATDGQDGGDTRAVVGGTTLRGNGGQRGEYDDSGDNNGGSGSGGSTNRDGGSGDGASGNNGGGGGGAIGNVDAEESSCVGGTGAQAADVQGLFAVLATLGIPTAGPGAAGICDSNSANTSHGGNATGFGSGGGGAGQYGGNGGSGSYGGGGGGAAGGTSASFTGGAGGTGVVVISTQ